MNRGEVGDGGAVEQGSRGAGEQGRAARRGDPPSPRLPPSLKLQRTRLEAAAGDGFLWSLGWDRAFLNRSYGSYRTYSGAAGHCRAGGKTNMRSAF